MADALTRHRLASDSLHAPHGHCAFRAVRPSPAALTHHAAAPADPPPTMSAPTLNTSHTGRAALGVDQKMAGRGEGDSPLAGRLDLDLLSNTYGDRKPLAGRQRAGTPPARSRLPCFPCARLPPGAAAARVQTRCGGAVCVCARARKQATARMAAIQSDSGSGSSSSVDTRVCPCVA